MNIQKYFTIIRQIAGLLKTLPVECAITLFITVTIIIISLALFGMTTILTTLITIIVTLFGTIYVALKYRLDQASYHKDLFEKRFEIFMIINDVLMKWSRDARSSKNLYHDISGTIIWRSNALFSPKTFEFIKKFREAIIFTERMEDEKFPEHGNKQIMDYKVFLGSLIDGENLIKNFPELKIDSY